MRRSLFALSLAILACGCDRGSNDEAGASCEDTRSALAVDETSTLGFSAQQVIDLLATTYPENLRWTDDDSQTDLTITVAYNDGAVYYVDSEVVDDGSGMEAYPLCEDRIEIEATVQFATADGAFNETWNVTLSAASAEQASFNVDIDPDTMTGTYDYRGLDPADYDSVKAYLRTTLSEGAAEGALTEQGEKVEGDTASATATEIAVWPGTDAL